MRPSDSSPLAILSNIMKSGDFRVLERLSSDHERDSAAVLVAEAVGQ